MKYHYIATSKSALRYFNIYTVKACVAVHAKQSALRDRLFNQVFTAGHKNSC
jgi:hypothetical protein